MSAHKRPHPESGDASTPPEKKYKMLKDLVPNKTGGTIRGRVQSKEAVRTRRIGSGISRRFSFIMYDETKEIIVFANGPFADDIHDRIEVGNCYEITTYLVTESPQSSETSPHCAIHLTKVPTPLRKIIPITFLRISNASTSILSLRSSFRKS